MKPPAFAYERPKTVDDAVDFLSTNGEETTVLAGGQSLIPRMNFRTVEPGTVLDINELDELDYLRAEDGHVALGALTRQSAARNSPVVEEHCPLVADALRQVGHEATRHRGTIGGNVANADPRSELPTVVAALDGAVSVRGPDGERSIDAADFFEGDMTTALDSDELLTEVRVPALDGDGYAFVEESVIGEDWPLVGVAATLTVADDVCRNVRLGYAGADDSPTRIEAVEAVVEGEPATAETFAAAGEAARDHVEVSAQAEPSAVDLQVNQVTIDGHASTTIHADPAYKRDLASTVTRRALERAAKRARTR
jgi:CO/xanthine dehydrogenase FAD-binding subunit